MTGAQGRPSPSARRSDAWGVLIVLLLVVAVGVWLYFQHRPGPATAPEPTATQGQGAVFGGMPRPKNAAESVQVLENIGYSVGYSNVRKDPLWVAYRLFAVAHPPVLARPPGTAFSVDQRTSARVSSRDYTGSGYDRGHMAPNHAIATRYGEKAQLETFLMSNIVPQFHDINAGVWEEIEAQEADVYANRYGTLWVIDGPVFDAVPKKLRSGVEIPGGFYKILVRQQNGQPECLAFLVPQPSRKLDLPAQATPRQYLTTVRHIEELSHLDFFWQLDPAFQEGLETHLTPLW